MRQGFDPILVTGSMSGNITSFGVEIGQVWACSIQANWYGIAGGTSGAGTLNLQVSNDNATYPMSGPPTGNDPAANVVNWTNYSGASQAVLAATGSSSFLWNLTSPGYRWVRLTYTATSGSGILSANYFGKGA